MSLQYHPDKVGGGADATKKFNEIKSARELLGSGNRRIMALPQWVEICIFVYSCYVLIVLFLLLSSLFFFVLVFFRGWFCNPKQTP